MKRKIVAFGVILLTLWAFSSVHAALVWQTDPYSFQYKVEKNGGLFSDGVLDGTGVFVPNDHRVSTKYSTPLDQHDPYSSVATTTLSQLSNNIQMTAWTAGPPTGVSPTNGLMVSGYTSFSNSNPAYIVDVDQAISSNVAREFSVSQLGTYNITANLLGTAEFASIADPSAARHAVATISGTVDLEEIIKSGTEVMAQDKIASISLNDMNRNDLKSVQLRSQTPEGYAVIYRFKTILDLKTDIQNFDYSGYPFAGSLNGTWNLGSLANPYTLQASLAESSPVPIPAPLILFVSGLGGLGFLRRRMKLS